MDSLPTIDLRPLRDGADVAKVAQALHHACMDLGFFTVIGHGIPGDLIDAMFGHARAFFALPVEEKMAIAIAKSDCHSGYAPMAAETLDDSVGGDLKETLDIGTDRSPEHPQVLAGTPLHGPAQWPESLLPEFKETAYEYARACLAVNAQLMSGMAVALGMRDDYFAPMFTDPISSIRLIHYPAVSAAGTSGAGAHTDYGSLTLLAQDDVGGLQVKSRGGSWIDVASPPGALVVNLGDMIARWTNHKYVSTEHRVLGPVGRDRYSIPYFVAPDFHTSIAAIPTCIGEGELPVYPPVTAGEYMLSRFAATHDYLKTDGAA
ncbi:isopenicillin N synthase family dioxygenase [Mycolicibacterium mengxianglii]|uniref:isopenicillin N synthase family dioxygenase n=1 Tax=Mycolicibacterium mengxianglii TaxID=2736649 RepID=UPI0018D060FC|nr:isopenicillin N synthase family oxygenase [Mycolicibacterium mengxianglii]